jgi:hypothetical protein
LEGLALEDVGILWSFGIFFPFWYVIPKKSGNPGKKLTEPLRQKRLLEQVNHRA